MRDALIRPKLLIADDHVVFREGLRLMLAPEFDITGDVDNGRDLVRENERLRPDVVLTDISMPVLNGIEASRQIRKATPETKIVILTMHADMTYASEVLAAGASGYVLKASGSAEIKQAIRAALAGRIYVAPQLAVDCGDQPIDEPVDLANRGMLTARQREVLQQLAEGRSSKEIADSLCVSRRTVEFHKYKMMKDLGLRSSADLIRYAVKHRFVSD